MSMTLCVRGNVLVSNKKTQSEEMDFSGMELDSEGDYLILKDEASTAELELNGRILKLPESSFVRLRGGQTWWDRHQEKWSKTFKLDVGRIWARIAGEPREEALCNAAVGVRG